MMSARSIKPPWLFTGLMAALIHLVSVVVLFGTIYLQSQFGERENTEVFIWAVGIVLMIADFPVYFAVADLIKPTTAALVEIGIWGLAGSLWWFLLGVAFGLIRQR